MLMLNYFLTLGPAVLTRGEDVPNGMEPILGESMWHNKFRLGTGKSLIFSFDANL